MEDLKVKVSGNTNITMTDEAIKNALRIQQENSEWLHLSLRLYLEGKGCDGFFYGVSFDAPQKEDLHFPQGEGLDLVVDPRTHEFTRGSLITWVDDERGRGFLVENSRHSKFRGKFYKRKFWQDRLKQSTPPSKS